MEYDMKIIMYILLFLWGGLQYGITQNSINIDLIYVEGGRFRMGSTTGSRNLSGESNEEPVHWVNVSEFAIQAVPQPSENRR
jgi:formylglycine-generating enzyme required for sulfatase activity